MYVAAMALMLTAVPPCAGKVTPRHAHARREFMRTNPCPAGPDQGSTRRCRGYIVDHICPLVCCGLDAPQNMQWQSRAQSKAKDAWERSCITCAPSGPTGQDGRRP